MAIKYVDIPPEGEARTQLVAKNAPATLARVVEMPEQAAGMTREAISNAANMIPQFMQNPKADLSPIPAGPDYMQEQAEATSPMESAMISAGREFDKLGAGAQKFWSMATDFGSSEG